MASFFVLALSFVIVSTVLWREALGQLSARQKDTLLRRHNDLRRQVSPRAANMLEMRWDDRLARVAQSYSQRCIWAHNSQRTGQFQGVGGTRTWQIGENLAVNTISNVDSMIENAMKGFFDERADYNFNSRQCKSGKICGHYTQMVWATSEAVGCGVYRCSRVSGWLNRAALYLTCNYGPSGNFVGQQPYTAGRQCTKCPSSAPRCNNGLCSRRAATRPETQPRKPETQPRTTTGDPMLRAMNALTSRVRAIENRLRRASAHLEGGAQKVTDITHPGAADIWNPSHAQSHMEGGFRYTRGQLIVPITGNYYVYSQVWNSEESGNRVRHFVYIDDRRAAVGGASVGTSQSTATSGVYRLKAGQKLSVRILKSGQTERHIWTGHHHTWFGAFLI
ncbi:peptidase inhibitor 16-like [Sycon ciliatum]|uniref:peptidase inhibitor 16-like n=1 Tax=Sycon ciliatum TaxID=27933 RepID=UPI0020AC317E|eukprot:scpid57091/ scgid21793/ Peptidase inhibitor 16; Cysteine-rich secretory protein 9; PSP94-binding protein